MQRAALVLLLGGLFGLACTGTEGTLVVRPEAVSGSSGSGNGGMAGAGGTAPITPGLYVPPHDATWAARLNGEVDIGLEVDFFYLDPEQQEPAELEQLHAEGRHYLCYLSAGSWEDFRDDSEDFPAQVIGNPLGSFPNENWLDIRDPAVRELMARRVTRLAEYGCDGVPPSSLTGYAADTGFELTLEDALDYARWLAERLHAAGMSAGLAGPQALTGELWPTFDFGFAIGCMEGSQCSAFDVFEQAPKPVLHVEFGDEDSAPDICNDASMLGFMPLVTDPGFSGGGVLCRDIL
jgi:hypothetical protein